MQVAHIKPKDSSHDSYLKCNIDEDEYDSEDEKIEFEEKLHSNIFCAFDPLSKKYYASSNRKSLIELSLHISKFISLIIESVYSRVAEPMKDEFCKNKNKKIADAVGSNFSEFLPDYYQEETLIRLVTDHEFEFIGATCKITFSA
ncbi:MAG: hypothetical protein QJT81_02165 [Candidatus Thiothrix putei]|uniref:Uncharacterized protein n=1 Tax=Candidatus Thiothrix putei TaxID=3080811 RepID=A0AA95HH17_9GAMM|nr:MAG: hypothetical protein QJT81_02165 [Candidatus Thiothrix putei]